MILPVTFLTVQKSSERSMVTPMKMLTKDEVKKYPKT